MIIPYTGIVVVSAAERDVVKRKLGKTSRKHVVPISPGQNVAGYRFHTVIIPEETQQNIYRTYPWKKYTTWLEEVAMRTEGEVINL